MKNSKFDLKIVFWLIVWAVMALLIIMNPLFRDHSNWYEYWYSYEYFAGFAFILLSLIFSQTRIKKINPGIALASSYLVVVAVVTIGLHFFTAERGWDLVGVFFLGYPSTRLTRWVRDFLEGPLNMDYGVYTEAMVFAVLGCIQYFLIGFTLEKIYRAISRKVKK